MKNALYVLLGVMAGFVLAGVLFFVSRAPAGNPILLQPAPTEAPIAVHVIGAVAIVPLVPMAVYNAVKDNRETHRKIVRWTWPTWFFVAFSGVVVYVMAQHIWPCEGPCLLSGINMPGQ